MTTAAGRMALRAWTRLKEWAASLGAGSRSRTGELSLVARLELGGKRSLLVVAFAGRRFLLAGGPEAISSMLEIRDGRERAGERIQEGRPRSRSTAAIAGNTLRRTKARRMRGSSAKTEQADSRHGESLWGMQ